MTDAAVDPKVHRIQLTVAAITVDERHGLAAMRRTQTQFFANHHGRRETFTAYRGGLIVRHTIDELVGSNRYGPRRPRRRTAVYLYTDDLEGRACLFCVSTFHDVDSIAQGKALIDRILASGQYTRET